MNSEQILQAALKNDRALFVDTLKSFALIDIGTIISINEGRALVHGSSFVGGRQVVYRNAEVIFPGNDFGVFAAACAGTTCLIFTPMSCMPNTETRVINFASTPYDAVGVKVLPIGNGRDNPIAVRFDEGMYRIMTDTYSMTFKEDSMGIFWKDALSSLEIDEAGDIHIVRQNQNTSYIQDITEGDVHIIRQGQNATYQQDITEDTVQTICTQGDKQWNIEISEGSLTLTQSANDQQTCKLTIDADGNVNVSAKSITLDNGDKNIVIDENGDVNIDAQNINLNGDSKRLVTYAELKAAMDKLWIAMTTTPIAGNGSPQPSWTGITSIDISASETQTIKTGG